MAQIHPLNSDSVIGVFDSGLGGLTVLRELERQYPNRSFVYLGDNARAPYGTKGEATISRYAKECANFLLRHEVGLIVVACNTVSSVALTDLSRDLSVPIVGTIEPAVKSALGCSERKKIAVIGTNATIASNAYERAINELDPSVTVISKACPLFVPLVESGMFDGEIVDRLVELYLGSLKAEAVDSIILGCTHYPLLARSIQKFLGPEVTIIECSVAVADAIRPYLIQNETQSDIPDRLKFFTTDEVGSFNQLAQALLNGAKVDAIRVENL